MAHIVRRRGRWVVRWRPFRGSPRERSRSFPRKADALAFLDRLARGEPADQDRRTFGDAFGRWTEAKGRRWSPSTADLHGRMARRWVLPRWETVPLSQIRPAELERWAAGLYDQLAPATVRKVWSLVRGPLEYATDRLEWVARNPARGVRLADLAPRADEAAPVALSTAEVERIAAAAGHYAPLVRFLAATGLRIGEAAALRVGDLSTVSPDTVAPAAVRVRLTVREVRGHLGEGPPKTPQARRTVTVDEDTARELSELAGDRPPGAHLFVTVRGRPLRPSNLRRNFAGWCTAAGVVATPHDLRHHHATVLLAEGVPVELVSKRLGHRDATITLRTYAHVLEGVDADTAAVYASVRDRPAGSPRETARVVPLNRQ